MRRGVEDVDTPPPADGPHDWRCKANGCPNAGTINAAFGVSRSGLCGLHYDEKDASQWDAVTQRIRLSPMLQDGWQPPAFGQPGFRDTITQREMREAIARALAPLFADDWT